MINAIPQIEPNSNSAIVTGYHSTCGMDSLNRYNTCQGGFIFSNGENVDIPLSDLNGNSNTHDMNSNSDGDGSRIIHTEETEKENK